MKSLQLRETAKCAIRMAPSAEPCCDYCRGPFTPKKPNQRFCNSKCQRLANWEKSVREAAINLLSEAIEQIRQKKIANRKIGNGAQP